MTPFRGHARRGPSLRLRAVLQPFRAMPVVFALFTACPAPAVDDNPYPYDAAPYDPRPLDPENYDPMAPPCAPESIVDFNTHGVREGNYLRIRVDTRFRKNEIRAQCVVEDSSEVVLRYRVPPRSERQVAAIRVTTITSATVANANDQGIYQPDPTDFDTVLAIRLGCELREATCNNNAFFQNAAGTLRTTQRSTVYHVGLEPEQTLFVLVDGYQGSRGIAEVTLEEIPELGRAGQPCFPVPIERALDPTAPTAHFRCPHPGLRCQPGAAPDSTDLCLPVIPLGQRCDLEGRFNVCAYEELGAVCARNPDDANDIRCALPGTAPGAPCRGVRGSTDRCDPGLACSPSADPYGMDHCVSVRNVGQPCDPEGSVNVCAPGLRCCAPGPDRLTEAVCRPSDSRPCYRPSVRPWDPFIPRAPWSPAQRMFPNRP